MDAQELYSRLAEEIEGLGELTHRDGLVRDQILSWVCSVRDEEDGNAIQAAATRAVWDYAEYTMPCRPEEQEKFTNRWRAQVILAIMEILEAT